MPADLYRIGAVAKRTGISPECLRAWERRYGLEPTERAGKTRFYDTGQIERLTLIKALLDQGHPISQVIHLPAEALERRSAPRRPAPPRGLPKVALVGAALVRAYREAEGKRFEAVAQWAGVTDLFRDAVPAALDCVVVYQPSLDVEQVAKIVDFCNAARIVVAFRYATAADLEASRIADYPLLRWPADWRRVEELAVTGIGYDVDDITRRFSDEELLHIAQASARGVCDCAHHLVALIGELNDYAAHARRCAADDRHDVIERDICTARALVERALQGQVEEYGLLVTAN